MLGLCEWDDIHHSKGMKGNISRQSKWQCIHLYTIHIFINSHQLRIWLLKLPFSPRKQSASSQSNKLLTVGAIQGAVCKSRNTLEILGKIKRTVISYLVH